MLTGSYRLLHPPCRMLSLTPAVPIKHGTAAAALSFLAEVHIRCRVGRLHSEYLFYFGDAYDVCRALQISNRLTGCDGCRHSCACKEVLQCATAPRIQPSDFWHTSRHASQRCVWTVPCFGRCVHAR